MRPAALVTGASSGIGEAFALRLAERGYDVILVARRRDRLEELAMRARTLGAERAEAIATDLSDAAGAEAVAAAVARLGIDVELLVNNAGFATHGEFAALAAAREHEEIAVNVDALVALTHAFLPAMLERGRGGVINVASTAAFAPVPYMAVYGATKAFVLSFSLALREEVRRRGVRVLALCPGATRTEFHAVSGTPTYASVRTARDVVESALRAYAAGKPVVVDGLANQILIALTGLVPRTTATRMAGRLMKPR